MTTATRCRAEGGPVTCTDPDCPEKRAGLEGFYGHKNPWDPQPAGAPTVRVLTGINAPGDPRLIDLNDRAREFKNRLTENEIGALSQYIDSSHPINTYLRGGTTALAKTFPATPIIINNLENTIHHIDTAINKQPTLAFPQILYRTHKPQGHTGPIEDYIAHHYPLGKGLHSKAYLSTTVDTDTVLPLSGHQNTVLFEILTHTQGAILHNLSDNYASHMEREILLPRDMKLRVTKIRDIRLQTSYTDSSAFARLRQRQYKLVRLEESY